MLSLSRAAVAAGVCATVVVATAAVAPASASLPGPATATTATQEVIGGPDLASPGVVVHLGPGATKLPDVHADTWLLADLTTGDVLAAKNAHGRVLPASTLKTLTAVTLMPKLDKNRVIVASDDNVRADGGHVGLVSGATYTIWDLWHGLLLPSANDAASALADANGGMAVTVKEMQAEAVKLGALDTSVRNDSGLDDLKQKSSAYDMALFARQAMTIPDFVTVTQSLSYDFPGKPVHHGHTRSTYKIYGQNRLLIHGYKGTIGGKTGFTSLAHRTFWGAASRNGHVLVVTLFQIKDPTEQAARALLDWGFANVGKVTPVGKLVTPSDLTPSPSSRPSPSSSAPAGGNSTAIAAASTPTQSRFRVPLKVVIALGAFIVALVGAALWWRRRTAAHTTPEPLVMSGGESSAEAVTAAAVTVERPPARRSSVVVSSPRAGARSDVAIDAAPPVWADAATDDVATDAPSEPIEPSPADRTDEIPVVRAESPEAPGDPQPAATLPEAPRPAPPAPTSARPAPASPGPSAGHVRVIRPPSRPS